jgi:hypothetical protein
MAAPDCDGHPPNPARERATTEQACKKTTVECLNSHSRLKTKLTQSPPLLIAHRRPIDMADRGRGIESKQVEAQRRSLLSERQS